MEYGYNTQENDYSLDRHVERRCVIVAGAEIEKPEFIKQYLHKEDYYIFCDCALRNADMIGFKPNLIVGDFDSFNISEKNDKFADVETMELPCEKDDTDSVFAVKEALKRGFENFLIIGAIGQRLDHTLGNVSILAMLDSLNVKATIIDDYSEISVVSNEPAMITDRCRYFSLVNVFGETSGICIKNAKYPLENAEITCEYQYGISNEVLPGKTAEVSVDNGRLLLIKVYSPEKK